MSWDERFKRGEHTDRIPMAFLVELAERLDRPGKALDLACGAGRHAVLFAERSWDVTAVDSSEVALELLQGREPRVRTVAADLEKGFFDLGSAEWDLVIVTLYLQRNLFERIRRAVKPGGRVAMAIPLVDPREGVKPMNPDYLLQGGELAAEFPGWSIEHERETNPDPPSRQIGELVAVR